MFVFFPDRLPGDDGLRGDDRFRDHLPNKLNNDCRHKFAKTKRRETNWRDYDAALVRRGNLIEWLTEEAIAT